METTRNDIKQHVVWMLKERGIASQRELAKLMGITPQHLSSVLNGRDKPGRELLEKLALALEVSSSELLHLFEKGDSSLGPTEGGFVSILLEVEDKVPGCRSGPPKRVKAYVGFREEWLYQKGAPKHMALYRASGIGPAIPDGGMVLVDRRQRKLKAGGIFLVSFQDEDMLRHVTEVDGNTLMWPGPEGEIVVVQEADHFKVLGTAIWYGCDL